MRSLGATLTLGFFVTVGVGGAAAGVASECVDEAKELRQLCRMDCDQEYVLTRDVCRNVDPECAAGCRAAKAECRDAIAGALESCFAGCRTQLQLDRAACPRRGRGRDFCVDRAQVRAFMCKDECRETLRVRASLDACHATFRSCMAGCGLPPAPEPTVTAPTAPPTAVPTAPPPAPTVAPTAMPAPEPTETPLVPR